MKIGQYATVLASLCSFAPALASPAKFGKLQLGNRTPAPKDRVDKTKNKYFHEPGGDNTLGHYDNRYFGGVVSYDQRRETQLHMVHAYLKFFQDQGLDTWIAHGTLLGWWWNGKRLPWDFDLDTQVSGATLKYLGDNHNQSMHKYVSKDGKVEREYLLDVNSWIWERERGDGMNIIDARWIDIRNGLFIDITGLSETHPDTSPGVWSCKNYHRYKTSELYPMRETVFEGVPAKVPYAYDKILVDEYKEKALVDTEFEGHQWDSSMKEWVKTQATIEEERKKEEEAQRKKVEEDRKLKKQQEERQRKKAEAERWQAESETSEDEKSST